MIKITREQLSQMYNSNDNKEVCRQLGITNVTLVSLLKRYGIKTKGKGNRKPKYKITVIG